MHDNGENTNESMLWQRQEPYQGATQLKSAKLYGRSGTGWTCAQQYVTMDGKLVTHFGLDHNMHRYYRTEDGAIYQRQTDGWIQITPVVPFETF
jgi:hypothetical protein